MPNLQDGILHEGDILTFQEVGPNPRPGVKGGVHNCHGRQKSKLRLCLCSRRRHNTLYWRCLICKKNYCTLKTFFLESSMYVFFVQLRHPPYKVRYIFREVRTSFLKNRMPPSCNSSSCRLNIHRKGEMSSCRQYIFAKCMVAIKWFFFQIVRFSEKLRCPQ